MEKIALETPGVAHTLGNPGRSFVLNAIGSNLGSMFITFDPFHERRDPSLSGEAIAAELRRRFQQEIPEARINVFGAPAVDGLGSAGGFRPRVTARRGRDAQTLEPEADKLAVEGHNRAGILHL